MNTLKQIWSTLEKHRFSVIVPALGLILWMYAGVSCTPTTPSPIRPTVQLNASELSLEYDKWMATIDVQAKGFEWAASDIENQKQRLGAVQDTLLSLASGSVTSWGGLVQILISSGLVGFFADNVRKNGVIAGLKRNKVVS